jgi:hypothetical protein
VEERPEKDQPEITPDSTAEVPATSDKEGTSEIPEVIITRTGEVPAASDKEGTSEIPEVIVTRTDEVPVVSDKEGTSEVPEVIITRTGEIPEVIITRTDEVPAASSTPEVPAADDADSTSEVPAASSAESAPAAPADTPIAAVANSQKSRLNSMLTSTRVRLQFGGGQDWREVVYTPEIDALLATLALENDEVPVAEAAARAIGRIRSEAAVKVLAEHQRKGERRALRALALVRDEAPSLPKSVSRQARLYTWLANTWRRLSDQPIHIVVRYICAAIFAAIPLTWYVVYQLQGGVLLAQERVGRAVTSGISFGVVFGLVIVLGAELPERLRGFWPWWGRLLLNLVLGIASGFLVWLVLRYFFLYLDFTTEDFGTLFIGGLGAAVACALSALFYIPGWLGAIWTALSIYTSLYASWAHDNHFYSLIFTRPAVPANFFYEGSPAADAEHISQFAIPIAILIGIGAYLPQLVAEARHLIRRLRTSRTAPAAEAPATAVT